MQTSPRELLICTDLDRTLIPNGTQSESAAARQLFRALVARSGVTLAYVSGRDETLVRKAIAHYSLPQPDYVIGDVGTTIYAVDDRPAWQPLTAWVDSIADDWRDNSHEDLKQLLSDLSDLRLQEHSKQNRYKLSYYVPQHPRIQAVIEQVEARFAASGIQANVIYSFDEPAGVGLIDVLPASASKLHAIEFLMQRQAFGLGNTVFSGDSGNDLEVLTSPVASVLVANAVDDIKRRAAEQAAAAGNGDALYVATGGFLGMNGNYAAGILEGVAHYHPSVRRWLQTQVADG